MDLPIDQYNIQLFPEEATIAVGETLEMAYDINPWVYTYLTMNISDTNILSMPEFGVITGQAPGTAEVSVKLLLNGKTATSKITVIQPATKITLNKTSLSLDLGQTANLFANVSPVDVTDATVTWTSSNVDVATVEDGKVTAIAGGECDITATTHNGLTATCHVKVIQNPESIVLNTNELTLEVGNTSQLEVEFSPSTTTERNVTWSSSDTDVASVENGTVTAKKAGEAIITATTENGLTAECNVTVTQPVTKIEVNAVESSIFVGESIQLSATTFPGDATDKSITWDSTDESIAIVDDNGMVTGVASGSCEISATAANGVSASCAITVKQYAAGIQLSKESLVMTVGDSDTLTVEFSPESATEKDLTWVSSDSSVATVSDGIITALKGGIATITATTVNGLTASCEVTVIQPVEAIELNVQYSEIFTYETIQLTATIYPADATDQNVTWSSSDETVATVDNGGLVKGISAGQCEIIATSSNCLTARCTITVKQMANEITVIPSSIELTVGESQNLEVTFRPETTTERTLTWVSSDPDVAAVVDGTVTAIAPGEAVITASTEYGLTAQCNVTVLPILIETIQLDVTDAEMYVGEELQLTATVLPENATDKTVVWSSDNEDVATVDQSGLVTVVGPGYAVIMATAADDSNVSASCYITCIETNVEAIFAKSGSADIYSLDGLLLRKAAARGDIDALTPGVYILRTAGWTLKVTIKK